MFLFLRGESRDGVISHDLRFEDFFIRFISGAYSSLYQCLGAGNSTLHVLPFRNIVPNLIPYNS